MKSFGRYISKYFVSFSVLIIGLMLFNLFAFIWSFHRIVLNYGETSPQNMAADVDAASTPEGITDEMRGRLRSQNIWAMFLNSSGHRLWSVDLPAEIPADYFVQDVAAFTKGYLCDYPVFVRCREDGLVVLGYPKESYMKITGNYYPMDAIKILPIFFCVMLAFDLTALFLAYYFSRRKIICLTEPLISAITSLSEGKPISLSVSGDLSEVADSVNRASRILSRQNQARANWINGVSHDIRTPLSVIMGYSGRIAGDSAANDSIKIQAETIKRQSMKIKDLVADLNLVSQLEYDMQPLQIENLHPVELAREVICSFLDGGLKDCYFIDFVSDPQSEMEIITGDQALIKRALQNLIQNSVTHNPNGCSISVAVLCNENGVTITVSDDGIGVSADKLKDLNRKKYCMESSDEKLNLRHGLGILLVRQIIEAHNGTMKIESVPQNGYQTVLTFPNCQV